jgi:dTDP-glucose pyrophosphorylase
MWGIIPAAGAGSRIQPLAFSKELLPVGNDRSEGVERPRAVSEYLVERMIVAGANKLCFIISPAKTDIVSYYGSRACGAEVMYVVQPKPAGLCDAIFRAAPFVHDGEPVIVGLPDTIWHPTDALRSLPDDELSFLLFPVDHPECFDAVRTDAAGRVEQIHVKEAGAPTRWIWGAFKMPCGVFHELHSLWQSPARRDEYVGTLVNAWLAEGGVARGVRAGTQYIDTGTLEGYRTAMHMLHPGQPQWSGLPLMKREEVVAHEFANKDGG